MLLEHVFLAVCIKGDASMDRTFEATRFTERMLLGVRCWVRAAITLRAQSEILFVFRDDEMRERCPDEAAWKIEPTKDETRRAARW